MDQLLLARFQFASTTIFHFLFVPLSIGLVFMVALMETLHVFRKNQSIVKWRYSGGIYSCSILLWVLLPVLYKSSSLG